MAYYNLQVKEFPDGSKQYFYLENGKYYDYEEVEDREVVHDGSEVERKEEENAARARQIVFDIARSNKWDWFITITMDPKLIDRYDYNACAAEIMRYTRFLRDHGCESLIVPEQHKDSAFHFHGLVRGDLPVVPSAVSDEVFNLKGYSMGFTTASKVKDSKKVSSYLSKYISKDMSVPKGRKRYWASKSLSRPKVSKIVLFDDIIHGMINDARYTKKINSVFGKFILFED